MRKKFAYWRIRWRNWNYRQSVCAYNSLFMGIDEDAEIAYEKHPYAWWCIVLIPIAGIVFFDGVVREYRIAQRWKALREWKASHSKKETKL